ncbi:MAG: hypothetical protein WCI02_12605 [Planctomycetota bacterium]
MATQHHGDGNQSELLKRFKEQQTGEYMRRFPNGRTGADDDGELTYMIAADPRHRTIIIRFAHPTEWIGLDVASAKALRDAIDAKLLEVHGITV